VGWIRSKNRTKATIGVTLDGREIRPSDFGPLAPDLARSPPSEPGLRSRDLPGHHPRPKQPSSQFDQTRIKTKITIADVAEASKIWCLQAQTCQFHNLVAAWTNFYMTDYTPARLNPRPNCHSPLARRNQRTHPFLLANHHRVDKSCGHEIL